MSCVAHICLTAYFLWWRKREPGWAGEGEREGCGEEGGKSSHWKGSVVGRAEQKSFPGSLPLCATLPCPRLASGCGGGGTQGSLFLGGRGSLVLQPGPAQRSRCCWPCGAALRCAGLLVPPGIQLKQSSLCSFDLLAGSQANSLRISSAALPSRPPPQPLLPDLLQSAEGKAVCSSIRTPPPCPSPVLWLPPKCCFPRRPRPGCRVRERRGESQAGGEEEVSQPGSSAGSGLSQKGAGRCTSGRARIGADLSAPAASGPALLGLTPGLLGGLIRNLSAPCRMPPPEHTELRHMN